MRLINLYILTGLVNAYPKGNAICDAGRRMSCRYCVEACGTPKCGPVSIIYITIDPVFLIK